MPAYPAPGTPLPFEKALNFRELGGYPAADGRTVRHGLLWRGANLDAITSDADRALYASLGIRYILDLRAAIETASHPDLVLPGTRYERICAMRFLDGQEIDFSPAGMAKMAGERDQVAKELGHYPSEFEMFRELYARMPFDNPAFRALFRAMEAGEAPLLFHCSVGKDRTGVGAMLILLALGASRETALRDYMQTNVCRKPAIEAFLAAHADEIKTDADRVRLESMEGVVLPMAEYTLDAIEARYPSYEAYFEAQYGLDAARLTALRDRYLE